MAVANRLKKLVVQPTILHVLGELVPTVLVVLE